METEQKSNVIQFPLEKRMKDISLEDFFKKSNEYEDMFYGRKTNPSLTYISICEEFKENQPGEDWDGVYTFKQK